MKPTAKQAFIDLAIAFGYKNVEEFLKNASLEEIKNESVIITKNIRYYKARLTTEEIKKNSVSLNINLKERFPSILKKDGFEFKWAESTNPDLFLFYDLDFSFDEDSIEWHINPRPEANILLERLQEASKDNHTDFWRLVIANKDRLILSISPHNTFVSIKDTLTKVYVAHIGYDYGILPLLKAVGIEYELLNYSNEKTKDE